MTRMTLVLCLLGPLSLAGCQTGAMPLTMTVDAQTTDPQVTDGDVLASRRNRGANIPPLQGTRNVAIRSYAYAEGQAGPLARREEITGMRCLVESEGWRANVRTPAQVRVPFYGFASPEITATCRAPGYRVGIASVRVADATRSARRAVGIGGGVVGVVAVEAINLIDNPENNEFDYPQIEVIMNRENCDLEPGGCRSR